MEKNLNLLLLRNEIENKLLFFRSKCSVKGDEIEKENSPKEQKEIYFYDGLLHCRVNDLVLGIR